MIDNYGREINYLRLSVTQLCNLRCRYCMPEDGVCKKRHDEMLSQEEMISAVRAAADLGIKKLRITGGEPLVKKNIVSICSQAASVSGIEQVCLTTNGVLLPELAASLRKAGVSRLNISLDTLNEEKYKYITRIGSLGDALRGLDAAFDAGFEKVKINAVLIGGFNDSEIPDLAGLTMKYPVDVRFIELMPMYDSGDFGPDAFIPGSVVLKMLPGLSECQSAGESLPTDGSLRTKSERSRYTDDRSAAMAPDVNEIDNGVAKLYSLPDALGRVGIISPLSSHFCSECNRIRITADGKIKPCLHSSAEYSIKGLTQDQMEERIKEAILAKPQWHGELSSVSRSRANRNMNQIGG